MSYLKILLFVGFVCLHCHSNAQTNNYPIETFTHMDYDDLQDGFLKTPGESGLRCYWWWLNSMATEESITRDLEQMKARGYGGASVVDAGSSNYQVAGKTAAGPVFMSPEWMDLYKHAVREAERIGIELSVNVQSGWNPGAPTITPEFAMKKIVFSETNVSGGKLIQLELPQPPVKLMYRDVMIQAVKNRESPVQNDAILNWDKKSFNEIIDLTDDFKDGVLNWNAPSGEWTIFRYGYTCTGAETSTNSDGWGGLSLDHLSPQAFELFSNTVIQPLIRTAQEAGNSVRFLQTDSWEMGVVNWTNNFPQEFEKFREYDLNNYMPALTGRVVESREVTNRFLHDFRQTVGDCVAENHYQLFYNLAHTNGKRFVAAEGPTSIGPQWERSPRDLKSNIDRVFCAGVNRIVWHTFTSSQEEFGLPGNEYFAGTHLNPNVTWWDQAGNFIGYLNRCSYMLQQGLFVADVLYYYGDDVPNFVFLKDEYKELSDGYNWDKCSKDILLDRVSVENGKLVLPDGMSYRVLVLPGEEAINLDVLRKIEELVKQGITVISPRPVKATGLSGYPESDHEIEVIAKRMWGNVDGEDITENKYGKGRVVWDQDINEILAGMGMHPDLEFKSNNENTALDFIHRTTDDQEIFFVVNRYVRRGNDDFEYRYLPGLPDRYEQVECKFRVTGKVPELWDPITGEITKLVVYREEGGYTIVPLHFEPEGSKFIIFREAKEGQSHITHITRDGRSFFPDNQFETNSSPCIEIISEKRHLYAHVTESGEYELTWSDGRKSVVKTENAVTQQPISGSWELSFDTAWGGPGKVFVDELKSWTEFTDEGIKFYSGTVTYNKTFSLGKREIKNRKLLLDLGNVQDMASININGRKMPVKWRLEIVNCLRESGIQKPT